MQEVKEGVATLHQAQWKEPVSSFISISAIGNKRICTEFGTGK